MKRKISLCSTGHGTGASYVRSLGESIRVAKMRKVEKKQARLARRMTRRKGAA